MAATKTMMATTMESETGVIVAPKGGQMPDVRITHIGGNRGKA